MPFSHLLAIILVADNGVAAGIMLSTVIGIVPLMLALPYGRYVQTVQFLRPRYDPVMPIMNGFALALDITLAASVNDTTVRASFVAAALLLATVMTISITKNVPVNRYIMGLDPTQKPEAWAHLDPRSRWRVWNFTRTSFALAAFVINVIAAVQLI